MARVGDDARPPARLQERREAEGMVDMPLSEDGSVHRRRIGGGGRSWRKRELTSTRPASVATPATPVR
jgi:hypothetical protein